MSETKTETFEEWLDTFSIGALKWKEEVKASRYCIERAWNHQQSEIDKLQDQLAWSIKNETQYKDETGKLLDEVNELKTQIKLLTECSYGKDFCEVKEPKFKCQGCKNKALVEEV